jgi:glutamate formiminotransferase/formiminotetrahydrofolate cyclodeaminase
MSIPGPATPQASLYVESLAAPTPTPGGGSASAVTAALAASLLQMVAGISLEKATDEQIPVLISSAQYAEQLRAQLLDLGSQDELAYGNYLAALRMTRMTVEERASRKEALERAIVDAANVPLGIAQAAFTLLEQIPNLSRVANPNLISDLATAAHIAYGAGNGALVMVKVNLDSIKNPETKTELTAKYDQLGVYLQLALSSALTLVAASNEDDQPF